MGKLYSSAMKGRWVLDRSCDPKVGVGGDGVRLLHRRPLRIVSNAEGFPPSSYIVPLFGLVLWKYLPKYCFLGRGCRIREPAE